MKTQRELNLEYWGRVHDMCAAYNEKHGTDVNPNQCVKWFDGREWKPYEPSNGVWFHEGIQHKFAVAILEGKPVFVGDKLYAKHNGAEVTVDTGIKVKHNIFSEELTWTPPAPKRTFTLNGVELPCPEKNIDTREQYSLGINTGSIYWFATRGDRDVVSEVLDRILTQARDS